MAVLMSAEVWAADTLTVKQLFAEMPDSVVPYLTRNNRLDFIDFMDSNMQAKVTNLFGGNSVMTALTADSLSLQLNESCQLDLLLLPVLQPVDSLRQVVCLVHTFKGGTEMAESSVDFFTTDWKPLSVKPVLAPLAEQRLEACIKKLDIVKKLSSLLNKQ